MPITLRRACRSPSPTGIAAIRGDVNPPAVLDCLRPGIDVVLHDVDPAPNVDPAAKGMTYLFANLVHEGEAARADDPGRTRTIVVPPDKDGLRARLLASLYAYSWEVEPSTAETTCVFA